MWIWDDDRLGAYADFPFATAREARWAASMIGGACRARVVTLQVYAASPGSYTDEGRERRDDPEGWAARAAAELAATAERAEEEIARIGFRPGADRLRESDEARVRRDPYRRMPPTRRRVRDATTIATPPGPETVFCDFRTGEPTARVPLLLGASYWTTGRLATVDVAIPDEASVAALRDPRWPDDELRAFLALELQYGELDVDAARGRLEAAWLEDQDALPAAADDTALHNSQLVIARRRGAARSYRPWIEDPRVLLPGVG